MRILFIITNLSLGGAESQLFKICDNLKKKNKIKVISLVSEGDVGLKLKNIGVELSVINFSKKRKFFSSFFMLCKTISDFNPNVVHTWMYHGNLIGGIAAKFSGLKNIIWSIHHNDLSLKHNKFSTLFFAKMGAFLSYIIPKKITCVSNNVIINHINFGYDKNKLVYIPNGIDTVEFNKITKARESVIKKYNFSEKVNIIGFAARFDPIKNHESFFTSINKLKKSYPKKEIKILLSGKNIDSKNEELNNLLKKYELDNCSYLMGLLDNMPHFMSSIDLLVSTSYSESFSLVLAEALSCKTLCVSTIEGDPESLLEGISKRIPSGKNNLLSEEIYNMLNLNKVEKSKLQFKGRGKIVSTYSLNKVIKKYKSIY